MNAVERQRVDEEAFDRAAEKLLSIPLEKLRMKDNDWKKFDKNCAPSNAYVYTIQLLGDLRGKRVLDYGCGDGYLSMILARRGGLVWGFDISGKSIEVAMRRAVANSLEDKVCFDNMSAYKLRYEDEMFDLVIGLDILHHIEIDGATNEIARVLKKGGRAVFCEPLGDSPALQALRRIVPVKVAIHEGSQERPLTYRDVEELAKVFTQRGCKEFQLFSRLDRVVRLRRARPWINVCDNWLLDTFPALRRYARLIVIELTK